MTSKTKGLTKILAVLVVLALICSATPYWTVKADTYNSSITITGFTDDYYIGDSIKATTSDRTFETDYEGDTHVDWTITGGTAGATTSNPHEFTNAGAVNNYCCYSYFGNAGTVEICATLKTGTIANCKTSEVLASTTKTITVNTPTLSFDSIKSNSLKSITIQEGQQWNPSGTIQVNIKQTKGENSSISPAYLLSSGKLFNKNGITTTCTSVINNDGTATLTFSRTQYGQTLTIPIRLPVTVVKEFKPNNDGYYEITSVADYVNFIRIVNTDGEKTANVKLMTDLTFKAEDGFAYLGNSSIYNRISYAGEFDGNGHTITVDYAPTTGPAAIVGYGGPGLYVHDLTVKGSFTSKDNVAAAVVGNGDSNTKVINCVNKAAIKADKASSGTAGVVAHGGMGSLVSNCQNYGTIDGVSSVGGVVGVIVGEIKHCENYGDITCSSHSAGGILGSGGKVHDCYNEGNITQAGTKAGGIVGDIINGYTMKNCVNKGNIKSAGIAAGIVARIDMAIPMVLSNCYNFGNVDSDMTYVLTEGKNKGQVEGVASGIVGIQTDGTPIATYKDCYNFGMIQNGTGAGVMDITVGLLEDCLKDGDSNEFTISNCYWLKDTAADYCTRIDSPRTVKKSGGALTEDAMKTKFDTLKANNQVPYLDKIDTPYGNNVTTELKNKVSSLGNQVTELTNTISERDATISTLNTNVSNLEAQVSTLTNTVNEKETTIDTLNTNVTNLTNTVNENETTINNLNSNVAELNAAIAKLEGKLLLSTNPIKATCTVAKVDKYTNAGAAVTITWNSIPDAKYIVNGNEVTTNKYTDTIQPGKNATYSIYAVLEIGGETLKGATTTVTAQAAPCNVTSISASNQKGQKALVSWKAAKGASKYEVSISTSSKSTKVVTTTSSLKYTSSKLTKGKTYYVKVRAIGSNKVSGNWSTVKKVTIKK